MTREQTLEEVQKTLSTLDLTDDDFVPIDDIIHDYKVNNVESTRIKKGISIDLEFLGPCGDKINALLILDNNLDIELFSCSTSRIFDPLGTGLFNENKERIEKEIKSKLNLLKERRV